MGEVFLLVKRINKRGISKTDAGRGAQSVYTDAKGNVHIRRRASDDNIF